MRSFVAALTALTLTLPAGAQAAPAFADKYRVRVVAGFYTGLYESLALREVAYSGGSFWMAERRKRSTAGITGPTFRIERQWIDGRQCPALANVILRIAEIPRRSA